MPSRLVIDCETNGLINYQFNERPSVIWCAATQDVETGEKNHFTLFDSEEQKTAFKSLLDEYDEIICHNLICYDRQVFLYLLDYDVPINKCVDTLVLSTLWTPAQKKHSLEFYGELYGVKKPEHEDWTQFSPEMLHRCQQDVEINTRLYKDLIGKFKIKKFSSSSIRIEHHVAEMLRQQQENGFYVNRQNVHEIFCETKRSADALEKTFRRTFRPKPKPAFEEIEIEPRRTASGEIAKNTKGLKKYVGDPSILGGPFCPVDWEVFNPDSPTQRVKRLLEHGWTPLTYTPAGNPKFDEDSLLQDSLPSEVKQFGQYLMLRSRERTFKQWLDLADKDGYVHGKIIPLKAWTHRASHVNPNMGNVPRVTFVKKKPIKGIEGKFGFECRDAWQIEDKENNVLLGCDASGIQLRALAHYLKNDDYVEQILDPDKDIHTYNQELAEFDTRNKAKTFIYAFVLGAGNYKVGAIAAPDENEVEQLLSEIGGSNSLRSAAISSLTPLNIPDTDYNIALAYKGSLVKNKFERRLEGLTELKSTFKKGWITGLDGRKIKIEYPRLTLAALLQSFETIVMRWAMRYYHKEAEKAGLWFKQRNFVHDEFQIETRKDQADELAHIVENSFAYVGERLKTYCPLAGEAKIGLTWADTH